MPTCGRIEKPYIESDLNRHQYISCTVKPMMQSVRSAIGQEFITYLDL